MVVVTMVAPTVSEASATPAVGMEVGVGVAVALAPAHEHGSSEVFKVVVLLAEQLFETNAGIELDASR